MTLLTFPTIVDDLGDGKTGTPANKAWADAVEVEIEDKIHSSSNPTIAPKDTIDKVEAAKGSLTDVDTRISVSLNADGTLKVPSSIVTQSQLQAQMGAAINLAKNSTFFLWSAGLASAPDYYVITNGTISIAGLSETDTTRKIGAKCAKVTWSSGTATLVQKILNAAALASLDHLKTTKQGFGGWVKTSIPNHARIQLDDGTLTSETDYHTGGGTFEFLGGLHTMSGGATKLDIAGHVDSAGSAYFSGMGAAFSDFKPTFWYPEQVIRGHGMMELPGELAVGDGKKYLHFARPLRIDNLQAFMVTGPVTGSFDIDFEKRQASGWQSMVTAGAIVADGDEIGDMQPTGDYDHRCLSGLFLGSGAAFPAGLDNKLARLNIDAVGSGTAGSDMFLRIDGVQCVHPFEDQLGYDFLGV